MPSCWAASAILGSARFAELFLLDTKMKILILSASPQRDKLIDTLLAEKLMALGHKVLIQQMPFGARDAVLKMQPDIAIIPPIRSVFSYDFCAALCALGIGAVIRHIEPSCDQSDLKTMGESWRKVLVIKRPENVQLELMWGNVEANYVKKHYPKMNIAAVGAFVCHVYKDSRLGERVATCDEFIEKHKFNANRKTLLISSPWGLLDIESDYPGQSFLSCMSDKQGRDIWINMVKQVSAALGKDWNILLTLHPNLDIDLYNKALENIEIDTDSTATELLFHSDALIHAGSTMALEMHILDKPALQFGDVNSLDLPDGNWWQRRGVSISQISPFYTAAERLIDAIKQLPAGSNANQEAVKDLEKGRYGLMDGNATNRAVELIGRTKGKFKICWPMLPRKYNHALAFGDLEFALNQRICPICEQHFYVVRQEWLDLLLASLKDKPFILPEKMACPQCSSTLSPNIERSKRQFQQTMGQSNESKKKNPNS